jgi:hypothetical protein
MAPSFDALDEGVSVMPEVTLCRYCKQPINKDADAYVIVRRAVERFPEVLAHVECEQKRPTSYGAEELLRLLRWPWHSS